MEECMICLDEKEIFIFFHVIIKCAMIVFRRWFLIPINVHYAIKLLNHSMKLNLNFKSLFNR